MNEKEIDLIQESFKKVAPISEQAAEIFYNRLFELDPEVRKLFKTDLKEQGKKLMATLGFVVKGLKKLDEIVPDVEALAVRHNDYGVKDEDYTTVGNALLYTLKAGLGDDFTPEVRSAWVSAYKLLADTMKAAAKKAA